MRLKKLKDQWESEAEKIQLRWNGPLAGTPYERRTNAQREMVYGLIEPVADGSKRQILKQLARQDGNKEPRVAATDNPFYLGIVAFDPDCVFIADRQTRQRWAWSMLYAHWHGVPPELLTGFIYQAGGADTVMDKARAGGREPWFRGAPDPQLCARCTVKMADMASAAAASP